MPAVQPETLVRGEWERPAEEPYDPTEILEEADQPFPIAQEKSESKIPPRKSALPTSRRTESLPKETVKAAPKGVTSPARVLRRRDPTYPKSARRDGIEGRVVLSVQIRSDGRVGSVRVATSSGSAALDSAAISAMKSWVFAPEMKDGERVSITVNKAFLFALK
jgi:protein TonB